MVALNGCCYSVFYGIVTVYIYMFIGFPIMLRVRRVPNKHRVLLLCRSFILVGYLVYHVHLVEILNTCSMYKYARNGKLKKKM